jgi:diketogulonate reductase-like aldo/keto reductase
MGRADSWATKLARLEENVEAAAIELTPEELHEIASAEAQITLQGARYPEHLKQLIGR